MMKYLLKSLFISAGVALGLSTSAQIVFLVEEPASLAGSYDITYSSSNNWGADMDTVALTAEAVFAYDATAADSLVCNSVVNGSEVDGKIAVLYRGSCNFSLKAYNAQQAGAVACVIINNIPGAPVGMAGGTNGGDVTIPVVMISDVDGALLSSAISAGELVIYMGNNAGVFDYNLGTDLSKIGRATSFAIPKPLTPPDGDTLRLGLWTYNYGNQTATGAKVNAVLTRDNAEIFNETSTSSAILPGDSMYFSFPEMYLSEAGYYSLTYSLLTDSADQFSDDNEFETNFWINDAGIYSKSRIDSAGEAQVSGALRPGSPWSNWEWCTALKVGQSNDLVMTGVSFTATTGSDTSIHLEGKSIFPKVYQWDDFAPGGTVFGSLTELTNGSEVYDYQSDADYEFVTHYFEEPIILGNNQRYLTCLFVEDEDIYLGYDSDIDYAFNYDNLFEGEPVSPLYSFGDEVWYLLGYGTDAIPSIVSIFQDPNGIAEDVEALEVTPYPNPTMDFINIPLGDAMNGNVNVTVYDVEGRMVLSEELLQKNSSNIRMDVSKLASGIHIFNLQFEDNSTTSFRVVITR